MRLSFLLIISFAVTVHSISSLLPFFCEFDERVDPSIRWNKCLEFLNIDSLRTIYADWEKSFQRVNCDDTCAKTLTKVYEHRYPFHYQELIGIQSVLAQKGLVVSIEFLVAGQYYYEISHAFTYKAENNTNKTITVNTEPNTDNLHCTSILARDEHNRVFHGRNLDFKVRSYRNITTQVKWLGQSGFSFTSSQFIGEDIGSSTFTANEKFSISYNWRSDQSSLAEIINCASQNTTAAPLSNYFRELALNGSDYTAVKQLIIESQFCSAMYIIIAGKNENEGALIIKDEHGITNSTIEFSALPTSTWYIVQDNYDPWANLTNQYDNRRGRASKYLETIGRANGATHKGIFEALSVPTPDGLVRGVLNDQTIFTAIMDSRAGMHVTAVRNCTTL